MLAPVSVGLKFGFLIVLYLFLMWVAWSALRDLRRGRGGGGRSDRAAPYDATGMYDAAADLGEPDATGSSRGCSSSAPLDTRRASPTTSHGALPSAAETSRSGSTTRSPPRATPASRGRATSS